ncbi:MAG: hypothetical protein Roseis2KO_44050 [Roseivirga sp.]
MQYNVSITGTGTSLVDEGFSDVLANGSSNFTVTIERNDGQPFTFNSLLVRNTTKANTNVTVGGYKSGALVGSAVTVAPSFCGTNTAAVCAALNFSSIVVDEVRLESNNNDFVFDDFGASNTAVEPAPTSATVAATVFLEGAYNGTNLNTTLNAGIPTTQTYTNNGHAGAETAGSVPAGAVDWVLVELREAGSAAAALSATKVGSAAGFLMNDGTIKATDGTSNLTVSLSGNSGADFFVVIYHRNHLPIMSANAITESSSLYTIDFTSASANTYQGTTGLASLSGSKFGMLAGDADGDGDVDGTDLTTWRSQNGAAFVYNTTNGDLNLDGEINAVDRNDFQQKNSSKTSQVPTT